MKLHKLLCIAACAIPGLSCAVTDSLLDYRSLAYVEETVPQPVSSPPSVREDSPGECMLFGSGDLLLWKCRRGNLDYLVVNDTDEGATIYAGDVKNLEMDYDFGWRMALGLDCQHWDVRFGTTQFQAKKSTTYEADGDETLFATRIHPDRQANAHNANFEEACASFDVNLSVYDLMVGHSFRHSCDAILHVGAGVRHARLEQEYKTCYEQEDDDVTRVSECLDASGWGLVSQLDVLWYMNSRLGLMGRTGGSLLVGCSKSKVIERDYEDGDDFQALNVDLHNKETRLLATVELMAGLHLLLVDGDSFKLALETGYEYFCWINGGDFPQAVDDSVNAQLHRNASVIGFDGAFLRVWGAF